MYHCPFSLEWGTTFLQGETNLKYLQVPVTGL